MGEIADMMIGGEMCAMCGVYLDVDEGAGIPTYCSESCAKDAGFKKGEALIENEA